MKWISVKDRLPDYYDTLVTIKTKSIGEHRALFRKKYWLIRVEGKHCQVPLDEVTHWDI